MPVTWLCLSSRLLLTTKSDFLEILVGSLSASYLSYLLIVHFRHSLTNLSFSAILMIFLNASGFAQDNGFHLHPPFCLLMYGILEYRSWRKFPLWGVSHQWPPFLPLSISLWFMQYLITYASCFALNLGVIFHSPIEFF